MENFLAISSFQKSLLPEIYMILSFILDLCISPKFFLTTWFKIVEYMLPYRAKSTILSFSWAHGQIFLPTMWPRLSNGTSENVSNSLPLYFHSFSLKCKLHPWRCKYYTKWLHNNERMESNSLDDQMYHYCNSKMSHFCKKQIAFCFVSRCLSELLNSTIIV